jgi:L-asparagine transporter-like permease
MLMLQGAALRTRCCDASTIVYTASQKLSALRDALHHHFIALAERSHLSFVTLAGACLQWLIQCALDYSMPQQLFNIVLPPSASVQVS